MLKKIYYFLPLFLFCFASPHLQAKVEVKAVAFDFNGVIAKSNSEEVVNFIAHALKLSVHDAQTAIIEVKKVRSKEGDEEQFWIDFAKSKRRKLPDHWMEKLTDVRLNALKPIPGMVELVKELRAQGYQTALLSNAKKNQAEIKKRRGLYDLFHPVLLACELGVSKPHPKAYYLLLEKLRMDPEQVIFIDNKTENVKAANRVGIDAIEFVNAKQLIVSLQKRGITIK